MSLVIVNFTIFKTLVQCFCVFGIFDQNQCAKSMQPVSLKLCFSLTLKFITKHEKTSPYMKRSEKISAIISFRYFYIF